MRPGYSAFVVLLLSASVLGPGSSWATCEQGPIQAAAGPGTARTDALGDPLPAGAIARIGSSRGWIGDASSRIVFSLDGRFVTATSEQAKIPLRLWDPKTERLVRRLKELDPLGFAIHVAFSNDSSLIACADKARTIRVGSTATGQKICELVGPEDVHGIVFSPDGRRVHAHDGNKGNLWTWDAATGKVTRCLFLGWRSRRLFGGW